MSMADYPQETPKKLACEAIRHIFSFNVYKPSTLSYVDPAALDVQNLVNVVPYSSSQVSPISSVATAAPPLSAATTADSAGTAVAPLPDEGMVVDLAPPQSSAAVGAPPKSARSLSARPGVSVVLGSLSVSDRKKGEGSLSEGLKTTPAPRNRVMANPWLSPELLAVAKSSPREGSDAKRPKTRDSDSMPPKTGAMSLRSDETVAAAYLPPPAAPTTTRNTQESTTGSISNASAPISSLSSSSSQQGFAEVQKLTSRNAFAFGAAVAYRGQTVDLVLRLPVRNPGPASVASGTDFNHPHILPMRPLSSIYWSQLMLQEVGITHLESIPYYADSGDLMPRLWSGDLQHWVKSGAVGQHSLTERVETALVVAEQLLRVNAYLACLDIWHQDLKMDNVGVVGTYGEQYLPFIVLIDIDSCGFQREKHIGGAADIKGKRRYVYDRATKARHGNDAESADRPTESLFNYLTPPGWRRETSVAPLNFFAIAIILAQTVFPFHNRQVITTIMNEMEWAIPDTKKLLAHAKVPMAELPAYMRRMPSTDPDDSDDDVTLTVPQWQVHKFFTGQYPANIPNTKILQNLTNVLLAARSSARAPLKLLNNFRARGQTTEPCRNLYDLLALYAKIDAEQNAAPKSRKRRHDIDCRETCGVPPMDEIYPQNTFVPRSAPQKSRRQTCRKNCHRRARGAV